MRIAAMVIVAILLSGCADEQARDQAAAAEEAADAANERAERAEMAVEELEQRIQDIEGTLDQ